MKSIAVVTDSNCSMSMAQAKELGIYMLPMPFFMDGKEYLEEVDMTQEEFFQHLEANPATKVSTSQPSMESVTGLWDKLLKEYDEIVHIPMSSGLSSSCQTASMLADDYQGRVRVVNNQRISGTLRYSAIEALQQAKNGLSAAEIGDWLEETRFDSSIYITVATLKYLKQGGRITPAAAAIGTMLRLKPVLQIQGEKLDAFAKARTMTQAKKDHDPGHPGRHFQPFWRGHLSGCDPFLQSGSSGGIPEGSSGSLPQCEGDPYFPAFPQRILPYRPRSAGIYLLQDPQRNLVSIIKKIG